MSQSVRRRSDLLWKSQSMF